MRDPIFLSQLAFVAVTAGIVAAVVLHKTVRDPRFPIMALLISRGVLPAVVGLAWATDVLPDFTTMWAGRVAALVLVLGVLVGVLTVRTRGAEQFRAGRGLILGALAFAVLALLSEFATGEISGSTPFTLAGLVAVWLAATPSDWLLRQLKAILGLYVVGSALAAAFAPYAWTPYEVSLIGVDIRVHGLLPHANALGPVMLLYLIVEYAQPSRPWVRWGVGGTAVVLLVLAQSKTAWAAALVVAVILWAGRSRRGAVSRLVAIGMIGVTCVALVALTEDAAEYEVVAAEQVDSLRTLTGRTALWAYGLDVWRSAPIFGAGSSVFRDHAERTGQHWAGQVHNQYVQTLGRHGILGLAGLLVYLGALLYYGTRHRHRTRYASMALVGLLVVRTVTEANLDTFGLEQLVVFGMLLAWERDHAEPPKAVEDVPVEGQPTAARSTVPPQPTSG